MFPVLRSYLEINTIAVVAQILQSHLQKNRLRRFGWYVSSDVHFESERSFTCPCLLFGPRIAAKRKLEPAFSQSTCVNDDNEDNADDIKKTIILRSGWT